MLLGSFLACWEDKQDIVSQSLARQGRQKSYRSKTLFIGDLGKLNVASQYHRDSSFFVQLLNIDIFSNAPHAV